MNAMHLTESQLDDLLIGDLAADAAAHLRACDLCQQRASAAEAPFASFREVSLAWAERRSATLPTGPQAVPSSRTPHRLAWAMAATGALAVGLAVPASRHNSVPAREPGAASSTLADASHSGMTTVTGISATPEQIAQDNAMLEAIDQALDAPAVSPASYGLDVSSPRTKAARPGSVQN